MSENVAVLSYKGAASFVYPKETVIINDTSIK